jgi:hypothetical protein
LNPDVVAYQTGSGMVMRRSLTDPHRDPPMSKVNPPVGQPVDDEDLVNLDLDQPAGFDDGSLSLDRLATESRRFCVPITRRRVQADAVGDSAAPRAR